MNNYMWYELYSIRILATRCAVWIVRRRPDELPKCSINYIKLLRVLLDLFCEHSGCVDNFSNSDKDIWTCSLINLIYAKNIWRLVYSSSIILFNCPNPPPALKAALDVRSFKRTVMRYACRTQSRTQPQRRFRFWEPSSCQGHSLQSGEQQDWALSIASTNAAES